MKKLFKKNQVIITALVVLVALAGYLSLVDEESLSIQSHKDVPTMADITTEEMAQNETGDAEVAEEESGITDISDEDVASRENAGEAVLVSNIVNRDYFESAKLSREQTRAKNKETLMELVNSTTATEAQKESAMKEIVSMTAVNEKETATENLLAAKGFENVVVTILDDSVDVIVDADQLEEQQIAQIEDVVKRKTEISADKIVISPVGKNK